jgi:tripartite-type tricarboxylate transporter receptor subunit TctC
MITKRRFLSLAYASGLASALPATWQSAQSQAVSNTTRILVGFTPGGAIDIVARLLVNEMKSNGSSAIVDNRPGAGGRVAFDALKASPADGSILILAPASIIVLYPHIYKTLNYDALHDFTPVTTVCSFPFLLSVGPMVPTQVKTLADFVEWCRANPGRASYGTPSAGSALHFTGVMLARAAGFEFVHVPYSGGPPAVQDALAGQIAATILPIGTPLPYVQSGNLRALVTTGPQRSSLLPDVPTIRETGYSALEAVEWFGIWVPAKTPAEIVGRLNNVIREALKTNNVRTGLAKMSIDVAGASPSDFARLIKSDFDRWGPIVRASGFTPED